MARTLISTHTSHDHSDLTPYDNDGDKPGMAVYPEETRLAVLIHRSSMNRAR